LVGSYFFRIWKTSFYALLAFTVSAEKSASIIILLPSHVALHFFLQPQVFCLFCTLSILTIMWCRVFFCSCLFGVLNVSYTWKSISFPRFGTFSAVISLDRYSMLLVSVSVPSSTAKIYRFGLPEFWKIVLIIAYFFFITIWI
jgi:hypothetical protein